MFRRLSHLFIAALVLVPVSGRAEDPVTARQWLERSHRARFPGADMRARFEIVVERSDGERLERAGTALRLTRDDRLADRLFVIDAPDSIAGIALLSKDVADEPAAQWLYLPAYRRARRVALHGAGDAFVGSDFNYADLARVRVEGGAHRLAGSRSVAGVECVVVETDNADPGLPYSKLVSMIDRRNALPVRVEYFDDDGQLAKVGTIETIALIDGWPTPTEISMSNRVTGGTSSIRLRDVRYDTGLTGEMFTTERLEAQGPPR